MISVIYAGLDIAVNTHDDHIICIGDNNKILKTIKKKFASITDDTIWINDVFKEYNVAQIRYDNYFKNDTNANKHIIEDIASSISSNVFKKSFCSLTINDYKDIYIDLQKKIGSDVMIITDELFLREFNNITLYVSKTGDKTSIKYHGVNANILRSGLLCFMSMFDIHAILK